MRDYKFQEKSHLVFLKFDSINNPSKLAGKLCFAKSLDGMSFLTSIKIPPPFQFLSSLKGFENLSIRNLDDGPVLFQFCFGKDQNTNLICYEKF